MLWIYLAEILLIVSMIFGFLSLLVMSMSEKDEGSAGPWTILWRIVLYGVLPIYVICLLQLPNSTSSWAGPRVALQVINILSLICALSGVACLTFLRDQSRSWLARKSHLVRLGAPLLICLWADGVAAAIPFMVRSSAHDIGWVDFKLPAAIAADAASHAAGEVNNLNRRHQICQRAVKQIQQGDVDLRLIDVSKTHSGRSGQYAIALPSITDPRSSPFELSYITSRPTRDMGPITHFGVVFYGDGRKSWCNIDESGTSEWLGRGSVSSAELRRLFVWAAGKAMQDAQYWRERRTRPLEWAAIGVLQEVGYDKFKIEPGNRQAELLDGILFWVKKLLQAAIVALLAKGFANAFKSSDPAPVSG